MHWLFVHSKINFQMKFNIFIIIFLIILNSCVDHPNSKLSNNLPVLEKFKNSGFTLVYQKNLFDKKFITKKIDERELIIFQKNLQKGTTVKITNPFNDKTIIAKVGKSSISKF